MSLRQSDRAVGRLLANPSLDAVFGAMTITDEDGATRREYRPSRYSWRRYLYLGDYVPTPTIIFRRRHLEQVGLLDEKYVDAADYDFFLRLFRGARVQALGEPLVRFRFHPDSKTARDAFRGQDEALAIRLKWATRSDQRLAMKAIDRAKRFVLPRISAWPRMFWSHQPRERRPESFSAVPESARIAHLFPPEHRTRSCSTRPGQGPIHRGSEHRTLRRLRLPRRKPLSDCSTGAGGGRRLPQRLDSRP